MSKIYLVGHKNPITVSPKVAKQVADIKANNEFLPNHVIQLEDFVAEKREIKSIVINDYDDNQSESSDGRKEENDRMYAQMEKEYESSLAVKCKTSWQEKSKVIKQYEVIYRSFGKEPTQEFREKVIERQVAYFQANPRHPFAIVGIKDLLPEPPKIQNYETLAHTSGIIPGRIINITYQSMFNALSTARRLSLI